ncbi:hypothetical protein JCM5353_001758 [Sporobolomyces roseus]
MPVAASTPSDPLVSFTDEYLFQAYRRFYTVCLDMYGSELPGALNPEDLEFNEDLALRDQYGVRKALVATSLPVPAFYYFSRPRYQDPKIRKPLKLYTRSMVPIEPSDRRAAYERDWRRLKNEQHPFVNIPAAPLPTHVSFMRQIELRADPFRPENTSQLMSEWLESQIARLADGSYVPWRLSEEQRLERQGYTDYNYTGPYNPRISHNISQVSPRTVAFPPIPPPPQFDANGPVWLPPAPQYTHPVDVSSRVSAHHLPGSSAVFHPPPPPPPQFNSRPSLIPVPPSHQLRNHSGSPVVAHSSAQLATYPANPSLPVGSNPPPLPPAWILSDSTHRKRPSGSGHQDGRSKRSHHHGFFYPHENPDQGPNQYSLSHRQQRIYQQDRAFGGLPF